MFRKPRIPTALLTVHALAIAILASSASGEEFSWQLSGGYGETEFPPFGDATTERTLLDATYYFDPVDDSRGPYALAPFLNRSGRVTAGITNDRTTYTTFTIPVLTTVDATAETTGLVVSGRYVWSQSGWYVGAAYRDADTDQEPSSQVPREDMTTDGYQLFGGRYFGESTSLDLSAGTTRQTTDLTLPCFTSLCLSATTATQIDTDDWSIGALHVRQGTRLSYSIAGRVSRADIAPSFGSWVLTLPPGAPPPAPTTTPVFTGISAVPFSGITAPFSGPLAIPDERATYSISGEIFPTDRLGVRIGLARSDGDYAEDESYDLAATWFFTRAVAVQFVVARTEDEIGSFKRDIDSAELRFFGRL